MTQPEKKLPYEAPAVRKVKLVQEEMAAAVCKTRTSTIGPTTGCFRSNCKARGS
ncbi:MAG: hypothetical protein WC713_11145 [Candidatus Methylomirabilota bacterium]